MFITEFLDKIKFDQHDNIRTMHMKKGAFDRYKFQSGKSSGLYSLQIAVTVWGSPKTILGFHNQLVLQELTESCYTCDYGLFHNFDLLFNSFFIFSAV